MEDKRIIVINEKWYESWAKDIMTYGGLAITTYANEFYLGGNDLVGLTLVVMVLGLVLGGLTKSGMAKMTDDEFILYLKKKHIDDKGEI